MGLPVRRNGRRRCCRSLRRRWRPRSGRPGACRPRGRPRQWPRRRWRYRPSCRRRLGRRAGRRVRSAQRAAIARGSRPAARHPDASRTAGPVFCPNRAGGRSGWPGWISQASMRASMEAARKYSASTAATADSPFGRVESARIRFLRRSIMKGGLYPEEFVETMGMGGGFGI